MTKDEAYEYFDDHWTDYNAIHALLDKIFDHHERQIALLKNAPSATVPPTEDQSELLRLKDLLKKCQDRLDEETHQLQKLQQKK